MSAGKVTRITTRTVIEANERGTVTLDVERDHGHWIAVVGRLEVEVLGGYLTVREHGAAISSVPLLRVPA